MRRNLLVSSRAKFALGTFALVAASALVLTPVAAVAANGDTLIVQLNSARIHGAEGDISKQAVADQRKSIASSTDQLLDRLSGEQVVARYKTVPFVAVHNSASIRSQLRASPLVGQVRVSESMESLTTGPGPTYLASSRALQAWAMPVPARGAGASVAIVGSGVSSTHPTTPKPVAEACFSTDLCPQNNRQGSYPGAGEACDIALYSNCEHETIVAGIAVGRPYYDTGSGYTYSGVAPGAGLISVQTTSREGNNATIEEWSAIAALDWLTQVADRQRIAAVNMSFGTSPTAAQSNYCDAAWPVWVASTRNLISKNVVPVGAGGNRSFSDRLYRPACLSTTIAAISRAASGDIDTRYNRSQTLQNQIAAQAAGMWVPTLTYPGGLAGPVEGSSFATPQVAGALAVLAGARPKLKATQLVNEMLFAGAGRAIDRTSGKIYRSLKIDGSLKSRRSLSTGIDWGTPIDQPDFAGVDRFRDVNQP